MPAVQPITPIEQRSHGEVRFFLEMLAVRPTLVQGIYYTCIGLWPWFSTPGFLWATDQQVDPWLVQTIGLLIAVIGTTLGIAGVRRDESWAISWLGLGSLAALIFCEIFFVSQGKLSSIHLVDTVVQGVLGGLWLLHWQLPADRLRSEPRA